MKRRTILPFSLFFFASFFFFVPLFAQQAGKQVPIKIPTTHAVDNALLYLPWDYNISGKTYPLICFFHGMGEAGNGGTELSRLANQGLPNVIKNGKPPYSVNSKGDTTRFIVLSIQAPASGYYSPTPEVMIAGISSLVNDYHLRIDANRVYTTGLSAGGRQSLWAVMNYPSTFPAGVIMSASSPIYSNKVDSFAHAYIWLFHGIYDATASPNNSYNTNDWINAKYPGHSRLTKYNSGHCCWNQFYDPSWEEGGMSIYDFLLQHTPSNGGTGSKPANQEPRAGAGGYQTITLPVSSVTLNGSGSYDPDGTIAAYQWRQISGPATAVFSSMTSATPTVSDLQAGVYVFDLTVTDDDGVTATGRTQVTVKAGADDEPPVASAGSDQTVGLPNSVVQLDASGSYDPDGTIASYQWTQVSGPSQASLSSPSAVTPAIGNLVAGVYIFELAVTDNAGNKSVVRIQVTVNAASDNKPPKAAAGGYQTITLPVSSVTLNGSGSYDPDGTIAAYRWSQISGPAKVTFSNTSTKNPTVSNLQAGEYVFELTVTDNDGATANGRTQVTVKPAVNNKPPRAAAGGYQTITLPVNSVTLNGSGSYDPDGTIAAYRWSQITGPATAAFSSTTGMNPKISNLQAGIYVFDLTVTDNDGAKAAGRTQVTVKPAVNNKPPKAAAGGYQTVTLPVSSVTLNGSGSYDPDGTIAAYRWNQITGPVKAVFSSTISMNPTISNLQAGEYVFDLTVTDNDGASAAGRTQVTVKPAVDNKPPRASAGGYQTITLPASSARLNASGSYDPDGSISAYQWSQIAGPTDAVFSSTSGMTPTVSKLQAGVYVFDLTVTDNEGATTDGRTQVTVFQPALSAMRMSNPQAAKLTAMKGMGVHSSDAYLKNNVTTSVIWSDSLKPQKGTDVLRIYPNPVHDMLYVNLGKSMPGKTVLRLINMRGQVIRSFNYPEAEGKGSKAINLYGLTPGMYIIQLWQNGQPVEARKIIKY